MKDINKNLFMETIRNLYDFIFAKAMIYILFIVATVLLMAQIGMVSNNIRPYLTHIDVFEGSVINEIDSLIKEGEIKIQLINMKSDSDIKILVNGIEVSDFSQNTRDIVVRNNSVVEIDGSNLKTPTKVRVVSQSENILNEITNDEVITNSNIRILCRIKMD